MKRCFRYPSAWSENGSRQDHVPLCLTWLIVRSAPLPASPVRPGQLGATEWFESGEEFCDCEDCRNATTPGHAGIRYLTIRFWICNYDPVGKHFRCLALKAKGELDPLLSLLRVDKARTMTIDSLRVVDASLRNELVKEGVFEQAAK